MTEMTMERLDELLERIQRFNDERDWNQFHTPANLAKSIAIEAGELLECYQWSDEPTDINAVKEELADVASYVLMMCQVLNVDLIDIVHKKMDLTEKKYPVEKAKGVATKYDKL